ncbi:hypothetical protein WOLCODRAFT_143577 [Wolfiporia cocos MD-104 SS10]|uniref:Aminoglycoside phosphotransferase domain-containing protein n=1 Tax=Wolfiporia cocos (strain MD-104) TaxID=742152 RepID=A0A2H3JNH7_WOLCO|nr:hypothetical protein WOLCODRAFT_143577 [Wolfiporia cocos MD-104 SS10]
MKSQLYRNTHHSSSDSLDRETAYEADCEDRGDSMKMTLDCGSDCDSTDYGIEYETDLPLHSGGYVSGTPRMCRVKNIIWAGEKMLKVHFDRYVFPNGPASLLVYMPSGRGKLAIEAYIGMSSIAERANIPVPVIVWSSDKYIFLEEPSGNSLNIEWPRMTIQERKAVCKKLCEHLMEMFHCRRDSICTVRAVNTNIRTEVDDQTFREDASFLLSQPFDAGPLATKTEPPPAFTSTADYLRALTQRIDDVFDDATTEIGSDDPQLCWPGRLYLTAYDVRLIRRTWMRLKWLAPHHCDDADITAVDVATEPQSCVKSISAVQSLRYALCHPDLQMSRIIVSYPDGNRHEPKLILTGWDHAYFAPLWSSARLPPWVTTSHILPRAPEPGVEHECEDDSDDDCELDCELDLQDVCQIDGQDDREDASEELVAWDPEWHHANKAGEMERLFEECAGGHWMYRDRIESCISLLKQKWGANMYPGVQDWGRLINDSEDQLQTYSDSSDV